MTFRRHLLKEFLMTSATNGLTLRTIALAYFDHFVIKHYSYERRSVGRIINCMSIQACSLC